MNMSDRIAEETALRNIMGDFIRSYAKRDKSVDFSKWLADRLQQETPDMPAGTGEKLSTEIIEAVAEYDRALDNLNKAIESGQSKEGWLADRLVEICNDAPLNVAGSKLQQANNDFAAANCEIIGDFPGRDTTSVDNIVEWNEYSLKTEALNIGKQAIMSGLGAAADIVKKNLENGELPDAGDVVSEVLQGCLDAAKGELAAVIAGALKAAAKGLAKLLPSDTSTETICDIAGIVVENAAALFDAAQGKISMAEALDKIGRASVAAACRWCAGLLKGKLARIPYVGPVVVQFAGGLLEHMEGSQFSENMYTLLRDAAIATWEGIKEAGRNMLNQLKNPNMVVQ